MIKEQLSKNILRLTPDTKNKATALPAMFSFEF